MYKKLYSNYIDIPMKDCTMPIITNSGHGNQGITVSVPVIIYYSYYECT
ncbi:hypothetical protein [uncultured Brachyspira sp.]|nr:hypothetical protein [uncultured Brachyspira sp.]